ncbi:MAG: addiction module toxin, HicA family [Acidobacteria bacterium]|nr:addiction module toxin, HicA family [Acidobacteriota bacterium]
MNERLPSLKPKKVMQALKRAGFYQDHVRGSHYYFKHHDDDSLLVVVPYHNKDLKRGTLLGIIAQADMTVDEFIGYL